MQSDTVDEALKLDIEDKDEVSPCWTSAKRAHPAEEQPAGSGAPAKSVNEGTSRPKRKAILSTLSWPLSDSKLGLWTRFRRAGVRVTTSLRRAVHVLHAIKKTCEARFHYNISIFAQAEGTLDGVEGPFHENRYHVLVCIPPWDAPPAALVRDFPRVCLLSCVPKVRGC